MFKGIKGLLATLAIATGAWAQLLYIPVSNISGVTTSATYNQTIALNATVEPANASNKTIAWSVVSGNATISGNNITFTKAGQVTIKATIANGLRNGVDYTKDFNINVAKATGTFGTPSALNTTYTPTLTLASVTPPANYEWNAPATSLSAGSGQTFPATYTDPSGNYNPATGNITVNVAKAAAPTGTPRTKHVAAGYAHTYHFDLATLLPNIQGLSGETYSPVITNNASGILGSLSYTSGNTLEIPVTNTGGARLTATITVTVSSQNYQDFTAVITVETKKLVYITGIAIADGIYNGNPHGYTGTPILTRDDGETVTDITLEVSYEATDGKSYKSITAPTAAGTYRLTLKVPDEAVYIGEREFGFTISKANGTGTVAITGWTYGQQANAPTISGQTAEYGVPSYTYSAQGANDYTATVPTAVGSYTVKATFAATANYNEHTATADFAIAKANGTGTVAITGWTFGQTANAPTTSGQTADYGEPSYTYSAKGANSYTATVPTAVGNYTVKATFAATANYNEYSTTADFAIAKANGTGTVAITGWTYGQTANAPTISGQTAEYGVPSYTYSARGANDYTATVPTAVGSYTVKATFAATANYNEHTATADFAIAKANGTGTVAITGWTYGQTANAPTVSGQTAEYGTPSYTYSAKDANSYTATVPTAVGNYTVKATFAATANYNEHTATADFAIAAIPTYAATVTNGTGGGNYEAGATVTLTANAPEAGMEFKNWDITPAVTFTAGNAATPEAEFTMPAEAVTATAVYEAIPVNNHLITVTVEGNGIANANVVSAPQGTEITLTATPHSGNRFVRWDVVSGGVTLSSAATAAATFTMPNNAVAVKAVFEVIPTPILPSQLASGNKAVQTSNGLNLTATGNATVEIFNLKGSLISRQNFASGVHAIQLGHLPKGMYIVKATFGNEKQVLRMAVR